MNIALGKPVLEKDVGNPDVATNGVVTGYKGSAGSRTFSYFKWPSSLTVDLQKQWIVKCIRFLLWDGMGKAGAPRDTRKYKYRLETSLDGEFYNVVFDTGEDGYNGWQQFLFHNGIETRYIRIYGRHNSRNDGFHVVEIEAYENDTPPKLDAEIVLEKKITISVPEPIIKGGPLSKVSAIVEALRKVQIELGSTKLDTICSDLVNVTGDLEILEKNIESVRRQIIGPVNTELRASYKLAKMSIALALISVLLSLKWDLLFERLLRIGRLVIGLF
jgi:hypothetical protein